MKWQIVLEVQLDGKPEDLQRVLDDTMESLLEASVEDPTVGATLSSGVVEIEFVVDAPALSVAQQKAHEIIAKALGVPADLIGESVRRDLVPA